MTLEGDYEGPEADVHRALLHLHNVAGTFRVDPGLIGGDRPAPGPALRLVAGAPLDEVTLGARLDVLSALARAGFPGYDEHAAAYHEVATTIGGDLVDPDTLLSDLKAAVDGTAAFATSVSGTTLPHEVAAFVMQDVCSTAAVRVNGLSATWIFSEFETDAPFRRVADWVNPTNWPARGPLLFKKMELIGDKPTVLPGPPNTDHWHGVFLEEVQLLERLKTLLHCDYYEQDGVFAGMTYALTFSVDNQLNVDRGFLLVNDVDGIRRVKVLKVVGFTDPIWQPVSQMVCPLWTDFVRGAAEGGSTTTPRPPATPGNGPAGRPARAFFDEWVGWMAEATKAYTGMAVDWMAAFSSGTYRRADLARDTERLWSRMAQDWSHVWDSGTDTWRRLLRPGPGTDLPDEGGSVAAGAAAPAAGSPDVGSGAGLDTAGPPEPGPPRERVIIPVPGLEPNVSFECPGLTRIGAHRTPLRADAIRLSRVRLTDALDGIEIDAATSNVPAGLYVGELTIRSGQAEDRVAAQLYVSKAVEEPSP